MSQTLDQASALLAAAQSTRMHAYISLCLATSIRTEEARALRWEHVDFGNPDADPPVLASAAVWRSIRSHGDTKTDKSRRTLAQPRMAVDALRAHKQRQAAHLQTAGARWSDHGLVFATRTGAPLDGVPVEEIARLTGHSSSRTTEVVYPTPPLRELRPVLTTGAEAMYTLFKTPAPK